MVEEIKTKTLPINGFEIAYTEIGPEDGRILFCVHGLLSNGRDYDALARTMAEKGFRVVAIDLPGRGKSGWFPDPKLYALPSYLPVCIEFANRIFGGKPFDFLGVSLGGMIGMSLHNMPGFNMQRLVLVDIGPEIPGPALDHVSTLARAPVQYATKDAAIAFLKKRCAGWGITDPAIWDHLTAHDIIGKADGTFHMHYDPAIGALSKVKGNETLAFWELWEQIRQPLFLIRGGKSIILPLEVAQRMQRDYKGPDMLTLTFTQCGHVPNLMQPEQIRPLGDWLKI